MGVDSRLTGRGWVGLTGPKRPLQVLSSPKQVLSSPLSGLTGPKRPLQQLVAHIVADTSEHSGTPLLSLKIHLVL